VKERQVGFDPRLRALYLLGVAIGVFLLPAWQLCAAAALAQIALWLGLGMGARPLARQLRKLLLLLAVIAAAYALAGEDPQHDRWTSVSIFGLFDVQVNVTGALVGLAMVLRIVTVVLASHVARAGDPRALAAGLGRLGLPPSAALALDTVLALLGDSGGGGGGGGGGGRHRHRHPDEARGMDRARDPHPGPTRPRTFWLSLRRLAHGDVGILVDRLDHQMSRAERHVRAAAPHQAEAGRLTRDVAVVAGLALTMLGIKALKLLPGLPFAPGHKGVLLIPLYIAAGLMTRSRAGATLTGLTMGTVAFLLGDGRYGVFEIAKHVAPGILVDLLLPIMRTGERTRGVVAWAIFGLVVALGRFATITVVALAVQAPALVYAVLIPALAVHAVFGVLSGLVTAPLTRALAERERRRDASGEPSE